MNSAESYVKKHQSLLRVFLGFALIGCYAYSKHAGLWDRYRWAGFVIGIAWALILILSSRTNERLGLWSGLAFSIFGALTLMHFLRGNGDPSNGLLAAMLLGFAGREVYLHYKGRKQVESSQASL